MLEALPLVGAYLVAGAILVGTGFPDEIRQFE